MMELGLGYDDVLLVPQYSSLGSRSECKTIQKIKLRHNCMYSLSPIIVSNMKVTATPEMAHALYDEDVLVPTHRFQTEECQKEEIKEVLSHPKRIITGGSLGLKEPDREEMVLKHCDWIFLELAHADMEKAHDYMVHLRRKMDDSQVLVVGNVCTPQATDRLFNFGADIVKVGQGNGGVCATRIVTGCGYPQFSAVRRCSEVGPIIADGGIKKGGDLVKALAAGAKFVMVGSLFSGTDEARGERIRGTGKKRYFGSASAENGYVEPGNVPEGVSVEVPYMGPAIEVAKELHGSLRQGMGMVGARNITELQKGAEFVRITPAGFIEGTIHVDR